MRNTNYLNEGKYQKMKKGLITIGFISLALAAVFLILGLTTNVPSMGEANWFESETRRSIFFMLTFVFGLMLPPTIFFTAFGREISAFGIQQTMPVVKEGIKEIAPTITEVGKERAKEMAPVYGEVAKEIAKGIKEGLDK